MALDLFRVGNGLELESEDFLSTANVLFGSGAPGGDAGVQDAANVGSLYLRTDVEANNLQLYIKNGIGSPSTASDWSLTATQSYVDAVASGVSWRQPARVLEDTLYTDIATAEAALNAGSPQFSIQGVLLQSGDRVLFTNITSGSPVTGDNENVYIVDFVGSPAVLTLTEDVKPAEDGDAILVQEGSFAETQWVYDGTQWIQFGAGASAELQFIRDFIGKNAAGAEVPNYSSTEVVTQGNDLEGGIGELDAVLGPVRDQQDIIFTPNVTTQTAVDSFAFLEAEWAKWLVTVEAVGLPNRRRFAEVDAISNGNVTDFNLFAQLRTGGPIAGLGVDVALVGSPGVLTLRVESTGGVDVTVKRLGFGTFN